MQIFDLNGERSSFLGDANGLVVQGTSTGLLVKGADAHPLSVINQNGQVLAVSFVPATSGNGLTAYSNNALTVGAANIPVQVKGTQGKIYGLRVVNTTADVAYLQIYNTPALGKVVNTDAPYMFIQLGANETLVYPIPEYGIGLGGTGICLAGTTLLAGGPVGAALSVSLLYA